MHGAFDGNRSLKPLAQVVHELGGRTPTSMGSSHASAAGNSCTWDEDAAGTMGTGAPTGGWSGLCQPDQPGQAAVADLTEGVEIGWSGALDHSNVPADIEPPRVPFVPVQEHFRLRDQAVGKGLAIGESQIDGRHAAMDHVRYVHQGPPVK